MVNEESYNVHFNPEFRNKQLIHMGEQLNNFFENIIEDIRRRYKPNDIVKLFIAHPSLQRVIVAYRGKLKDMDANSVLSEIERVVQSHELLAIDQNFKMSLHVIRVPTG